MKLVIEIEMNNAAFEEEDGRTEAARILRLLAEDLETGSRTRMGLYDINGNTVGTARIDNAGLEEDNA